MVNVGPDTFYNRKKTEKMVLTAPRQQASDRIAILFKRANNNDKTRLALWLTRIKTGDKELCKKIRKANSLDDIANL